jgi:hypothetical protein
MNVQSRELSVLVLVVVRVSSLAGFSKVCTVLISVRVYLSRLLFAECVGHLRPVGTSVPQASGPVVQQTTRR